MDSFGVIAGRKVHDLVTLAYGSRAYLADLQSRRRARDTTPGLLQRIDAANREVERIDLQILDLGRDVPCAAWELFDSIKGTHVGPIQRLSQRLKTVLPPRV